MRREVRPPLPAVIVLDPRMFVASMLVPPGEAMRTVQWLDAPFRPGSDAVRDGECGGIPAHGGRPLPFS